MMLGGALKRAESGGHLVIQRRSGDSRSMRPLRLALLIILLLAFTPFFFNKARATSEERAVLALIGRELLNRRNYDTCLATWTETDFYSGTYGFAEGGYRPDQARLDTIAERARGRSLSLYAGAPASTRPVLIALTLDMLMGCGHPIRLSTPIFVGDFAFVSAHFTDLSTGQSSRGEAFALQRVGKKWVLVGHTDWSNGVVR